MTTSCSRCEYNSNRKLKITIWIWGWGWRIWKNGVFYDIAKLLIGNLLGGKLNKYLFDLGYVDKVAKVEKGREPWKWNTEMEGWV